MEVKIVQFQLNIQKKVLKIFKKTKKKNDYSKKW